MHVAIVLFAIGVVVFGRALLRLLLTVIAVAVLVAIGTGAATLMHGVHL
jgi:hypothetical protein